MKSCKKTIASNIPGMADGGRPSPHMLGMGLARTAAGELGRRRSVIDSAVESATGSATPAAITAPAGYGGLSDRKDNATPPANMLVAQARGMADGGKPKVKPHGGKVTGPGGPTDDKAGTYRLSNKEYVLPADTTEAMGGPKALDKIRAATHKFVDPKNKPAIAKGLADGGQPWKSDFAKPASQLRTLPQVMFPSAPTQVAPIQPKPVGQSIGAGARVAADGASNAGVAIGQAARSLDDTRKGVLSVANNIPGAIAAPIATAADSFGADIRTGFTGQKYVGQQYVGKPLFGGGAADAPAAQPDMAAQLRAKSDAIINGDNRGQIDQSKISAGDRSFMHNRNAPAVPARPAIASQAALPDTNGITKTMQPNGTPLFSGGSGGYGVNPADHQAAVERAAADKASLSSLAIANLNSGTTDGMDRAYRLAAGDPAATAALENARQQQEMRQAVLKGNAGAASVINQQGANETNLATAKLKIASDLVPKAETAYDKERARGAKADNDRAAITDGLLNQYMNAPDEKTRNAALEKMNALGGKNNSDKYITIDQDAGVDALGNPITRKVPFNTRTGQVVATSAVAGEAKAGYPEGTKLNGPDGKMYVVKDGVPVLAS